MLDSPLGAIHLVFSFVGLVSVRFLCARSLFLWCRFRNCTFLSSFLVCDVHVCVCVWFFLLVNSIQNLHKYIYAFSFMHTEIHVMYHLGYSAFAFAVCLTGTRAARFALAGLLLVDWLAWENNCGLVEQRFHSKFPVNLFEFIYILAAISLHKLLLNIPKLRNLFSFEWTVRALCIALFRFSFSGVW